MAMEERTLGYVRSSQMTEQTIPSSILELIMSKYGYTVKTSVALDKLILKLLAEIKELGKKIDNITSYELPDTGVFQGSAKDGCFMVRNFDKNLTCPELEFDIVHLIGSFPTELIDNVKQIEGRPGYFKVVKTEDIQYYINRRYQEDIQFDENDKYIHSDRVFFVLYHRIIPSAFQQEKMQSIAKKSYPDIMIEFNWDYSNKRCEKHGKEVAIKTEYTVHGLHNSLKDCDCVKVSIDHVAAINLKFLPCTKMQWLVKGKWPSLEERERLIHDHGCCLVTKPSSTGKGDWRISFSDVESEIMSQIFDKAEHSYLIYFLFKGLYYRFIKPMVCGCLKEKGGVFPSYLAKTTFLQMSENNPPVKSNLWNDPGAALKLLFDTLSDHCHAKFIPHYFIQDMNIIENIIEDHCDTCDILHRVGNLSKQISQNLEKYIYQLEVEDCLNFFNLDFINNVTTALGPFCETVKQFLDNPSKLVHSTSLLSTIANENNLSSSAIKEKGLDMFITEFKENSTKQGHTIMPNVEKIIRMGIEFTLEAFYNAYVKHPDKKDGLLTWLENIFHLLNPPVSPHECYHTIELD